ncbi:MAG: hypothetical protein Q8P67_15770 [archaeon]|nr:hypothetical protein [archaeon]
MASMAEVRSFADIDCLEVIDFQQLLRGQRRADDNIIYALNRADSSRHHDKVDCGAMWAGLAQLHSDRNQAIATCMGFLDQRIAALEADKASEENVKKLRELKSKKSVYDSEILVEEILQSRNEDVFRKKCPVFRIPRS